MKSAEWNPIFLEMINIAFTKGEFILLDSFLGEEPQPIFQGAGFDSLVQLVTIPQKVFQILSRFQDQNETKDVVQPLEAISEAVGKKIENLGTLEKHFENLKRANDKLPEDFKDSSDGYDLKSVIEAIEKYMAIKKQFVN